METSSDESKRMRIGIDARLWAESGVGRYIRNLVLGLAAIDKKNEYTLFVKNSDKNEIEKLMGHNKKFTITEFNSGWHSLSEQISFPKAIYREKVDLMHFPYFSIPIFYKGPFIVTIHDLIYHHFISGEASTLPLWLYGFKMIAYRITINTAVRKAKKVIAVSNFTKDDIVDNLVVNKSKIEVVYEGADDFVASNGGVDNKGYFLFVGNVYPHKNAENLIKAFENFSKDIKLKLIFVGKEDYFYKKLRKKTKSLEKAGKIFFEFDVSDERLGKLYKNSIALIRPSFMEGFSLAPLEAITSGTIPLVSDIPVHREILKDAAVYFNANDVYDIVSGMNLVSKLTNQKRQALIIRGKEIVSSFSWKKTAEQTLQIYESSAGL